MVTRALGWGLLTLGVFCALEIGGCGGGGSGATGSAGAGAGSSGGAGTGSAGSTGTAGAGAPSACSAQADCPSGYVCVPDQGTIVEVPDQDCLSQCTPTCDLAGPLKDTCLQNCNDVCKKPGVPDGGTLTGHCLTSSTGSGGVGGSGAAGTGVQPTGAAGDGGGAGSGGGTAIKWEGTWTADVSHTSNCNFSSATQSAKQTYTVTISATGANTSPKATISGGFSLEGTGGDDHVNLTGDFPFRSWKGGVATTNSLNSPNNATIKITNVESANKASGTIEGTWDAGGGWTCKTASGTIQLSR